MFQNQENGYDRKSVDEYIAKLKNEIMEQKLSLLDNEQKYLDYREKLSELENREKNLYKAVAAFQDAQKIREEGTKTLYTLKLEQMNALYKKADMLLKTIYLRHPELQNDKQMKVMFDDFAQTYENAKIGEDYRGGLNTPISTENDSMRLLLSKMQDYRMTKDKPREVRFGRNQTETKIHIRPICSESKIGDVDDFLNSELAEETPLIKKQVEESGFNLDEAINPKEDLETIMKAFDFFSNND